MIADHLKGPNSYGTTWSLRHPVESRSDIIGRSAVTIYANQAQLPDQVMLRLQTAFQQNAAFDLVGAAGVEVTQAETNRVALMILWGKADLRL